MQLLPGKTSLTILSFSVLVLLLGTRKLAGPVDFDSVFDFHPRAVAAPLEGVITGAAPRRAASSKHIDAAVITPFSKGASVKAATIPLDDPSGPFAHLIEPRGSLDAFYRALSRTEAKQSVTRVLHYGDSPVTADSITADVRSLLQEQYGDAGHGFLLVAKPWAWYGHRGVDVRGSGWRIEPASQSHAKDGYHGLGGVSFRGEAGATSRIHLETAHNYIEIFFLRQPGGGSFVVKGGEQTLGEVNTDGPDKSSDWATFPLPTNIRDITISVQTGSVRLFGTSFEKNVPGVIYNSLGLNGGQVQVVLRYFEQRHWAAQLQHERPDLVVINYGTNESMFPGYIETYYRQELREVIHRVKSAVPNASVLVMSPMDRGQPGGGATVPILPRIVEIQREAAAETGCAFFNTFEAMGGAGTMARWYTMQPRLVSADFMHPLPGGARRVGVLLDRALTSGYERFKSGRVRILSENRPPEASDE
jgi:lysophospholipase L1-like esterase